MECKKYEIIEEGGRKRIRALRDFTVQDRHVCIGDLGGYVYDDKTLGQNCPAWIFSGSLEYPGIHVYDEAIVDMGSNEQFDATARMKRVLIHGKSRIMGMMQFVSNSTAEVAQTPDMYEQGYYEGYAGVPYEAAAREATDKVRSKTMVWSAGAGKILLPNDQYEVMCNKLDEDGITLATTAWRKGGVDVSIDLSDAAAFVLNVRKVGGGDITPANITEAGFSIQGSVQSSMDINNVNLSVSYDRTATPGTALNIRHIGTERSVLDNSTLRISYNATDKVVLILNTEMYRSNFLGALAAGATHTLFGIFRDVKSIKMGSDWVGSRDNDKFKDILDVSDCEAFILAPSVIPDIMEFYNKNGKLVFKGCNVPGGIFYYDHNPGGNVYTDIDFSKASEHLGKTLMEQEQTMLVSSTVEGMYRLYRNADDKVFGMLVQDYASVEHFGYGALEHSYDSVVYSDCVLDGVFNIIGCNVFGGTLGGASKVHSTSLDPVDINGNFRVEGNAQIEDTPLRGTGYIGGNAELKNGNVEGYIYMDGNAKYTPEKTNNVITLRNVIMRDNAQYLANRDEAKVISFQMYNNSVINGSIQSATGGADLIMRDNSKIDRALNSTAIICRGVVEMKDNASITGTGGVVVFGDVKFVGGFNLNIGTRNIYGKHMVASPDDLNRPELPPTKATW